MEEQNKKQSGIIAKYKILWRITACMLMSVLLFASLYTGKIVYAGNMIDSTFDLDFSGDSTNRATTGLSWEKDTGTDTYILTLDNIDLNDSRDIILPTDKKVIIRLIGNSNMYNGKLMTNGTYAFKITITGGGTLNTKALPSGGADGDTLTIEGGAKVYVKDRVSYGSSGGANGVLNVKGAGTLLDIDTSAGVDNKGTYLKEINITDGAELNIRATKIGAYTIEGSINVKNNSKLKVSGKYGVYIEDGKLTVDDTSTLETDSESAGITVVDTTGTKSQNDMLSLPDIPSGTNIVSVDKNGNKLWTLAKKGSTVEIEGSNITPADNIKGALSGKITIKKGVSSPSSDPSGGGSSGGGYFPGIPSLPDDDSSKEGTSDGKDKDSSSKDENNKNKVNVTAEVNVKAKKDKDKAANAEISENAVEDAVEKVKDEAKKNGKEIGKISLKINTDMPKGTDNLTLNIPEDVLDKISDGEIDSFTVNTPLVKLIFDKKAVLRIRKQCKKGGAVINIAPHKNRYKKAKKLIGKRPAYDIRVTCSKNKKRITDFGKGKVKVFILYAPAGNENIGRLYALNLNKKGRLKKAGGSIYDAKSGYVIFTAKHLSTCGIGYTAPKKK